MLQTVAQLWGSWNMWENNLCLVYFSLTILKRAAVYLKKKVSKIQNLTWKNNIIRGRCNAGGPLRNLLPVTPVTIRTSIMIATVIHESESYSFSDNSSFIQGAFFGSRYAEVNQVRICYDCTNCWLLRMVLQAKIVMLQRQRSMSYAEPRLRVWKHIGATTLSL